MFYLLGNDTTIDSLNAAEQLVCEIAVERQRSDERVPIVCGSEEQAYRLGEALWARPTESLVPHSLVEERPCSGVPVEIT